MTVLVFVVNLCVLVFMFEFVLFTSGGLNFNHPAVG